MICQRLNTNVIQMVQVQIRELIRGRLTAVRTPDPIPPGILCEGARQLYRVFVLKKQLRNEKTEEEILVYLENYEINKLDINRIYRYLERYTKETIVDDVDDDICSINGD